MILLLLLDEWLSPSVIGDRPPPIDDFTLTSITKNSAVFFGGITTNGSSNKLYFIDFTTTSVVSESFTVHFKFNFTSWWVMY